MKDNILTVAIFTAISIGIVCATVSHIVQIRYDAERTSAVEIERLGIELDELTAKLQALIEAKKAHPSSYYGLTPPPTEVGSAEWEADLRVKVRYMRWQVEFLITLHNLADKPPGGRKPIGQVIGEVHP